MIKVGLVLIDQWAEKIAIAKDDRNSSNGNMSFAQEERLTNSQESGSHLEQMLALSPAIIYSCGPGPDCPTTFISSNVAGQVGYEPAEFYADPFFWKNNIHPDDVDKVHTELARHDAGHITYEYRFRHRDGHYLWLHDRVAAIRNSDGSIEMLVGSWFDITGRRRARAMQEGQDRVHASLVRGNSLQTTLDELVRTIEQQAEGLWCSILVYDPVSRQLRHGAAPSLPADYNELIDGVVIGPCVGSCGTAVYRRERVVVEDIETDPLWQSFRDLARPFGLRACWSQPIFDEQGDVLGTFAMYYGKPRGPSPDELALIENAASLAAICIQRKNADKALVRSEAKYLDLYDNAPDMYVSVDADTGCIVECNSTFCKQTGYDRTQIIGREISSLYTNETREIARNAFMHFVECGEISNVELRLIRKDGSIVDVLLNASTVEPMNGTNRIIRSGIRDITERKRAEQQEHEHRAALAHANRLITSGELTAALAHELNQPLCAIVTNAHAALRLLAGDNTDLGEIVETLRDIASDGDRAGRIIHGVREFIKKKPPQCIAMNVNYAVESAVRLASLDPAYAGSIETDLAEDIPDVHGDITLIEQVLLNLILNGLEATLDQSPVAGRILIKTTNDDECVTIVISDNGPGLPDSDCRVLFEPFVTTKPSGLGMGLWICQSITETHGGRLWATSRSGHGAAFHLSLPIPEQTRETPT